MECASSAATEVMKCLAQATWQQARYSFCFDCLVEELDEEKKKLKANVEDMNDNVKESQENTVKVGKRLELELGKSKDVIKEVDELVKKVKPKKTCCHGPCPDLIWQYRFGRQVANKTEIMKKLNAQFQPQKLSRIQSLPGMAYYSSEAFMCFGSTKKASNDLLKALKNNKIRRIGLYGMGGCGKTTLVKEVGKEAEKLFKKVVFVAVSSSLDVRMIQGSIADALKLTLKEENEPERAKRLWMRLSGNEKILIILDDVWEELNFEAIGIPFGDDRKGCKILLTTRYRGVCVSLKCHRVRLDLLTENEAWVLFKKHAGINEDISKKSLKGLPQVINKACKGLPIAIAAVASALKDKALDEWKEVFDMLKRCEQVDIANNSKDPYASLQLSYDRLKKKEAKDLFLLCSLFPEDSEIKEEDLIRMGIGLGLFENAYSCDSTRIRGGATIRELLDSFLLLRAEKGRSVIQHDILRAVALRIAGKQIQTILEPTMPPTLTELAEFGGTEEITKLYCHNINEFPLQFQCPKLEILIVCKDGKGSSKVPNEFFNEMGRLKVMTVIDKSSWQKSTLMLPKSIWSLKCLRTLCIRGCKLDFIFSVENLQNLETLEFCNCSIMQLPNDIVELKKLKLLDVSGCRIGGNPYKVLGNCPRLEELYFSKNDLDEELLKHQNLAEFFGKDHYFTRLQRYHIQIGARVDKLNDDLKSGFLSICPYFDKDTSTSTAAIKDLAQRAEVLFLENVQKSCRNVIPDIVHEEGESMNELTELLLRNSDGIECLIDTTNQLSQVGTGLSNLHKLRITGMKHLEGFCHGQPPSALFEQLEELECSQLPILSSLGRPKLSNLRVLKLDSCPKLESLFTPAVAVSLVLLKELKITKCDGLMYIIGDDKEENITDDNDQKSYGLVFKKLTELVVGDCRKLEYLIPLSFARGLENLENLEIYAAPCLKYAFGQYNETQSSYQNQNESEIINLPVLKVLELRDLPNITNICPENCNAKFPDSLEPQVNLCPKLTNIISTNTPKVDSEIEVEAQQDGEPPKKAKLFMQSGICTSIVAKNVKEWVSAPGREFCYSLMFNKYVEDLRTEKDTLIFTRASLLDRVEEAKRKALKIDRHVEEWLRNAVILIEEAERLEQKAIANRSCCLGRIPNWIQRYRLGKRAARKINTMIEHNEIREFQKFLLSGLEPSFSKKFTSMDNRNPAYRQLLEALEEDEVSMIGLFGLGGSGKTTMVSQVGKEAAEQLFDRVVFVLVSNCPDVRKIQEEIARSLDLELKEENEEAKARRLFMRLSRGERILLILDDVWEMLNLEDIGIPFGYNHKYCRVLITTRNEAVCSMMGCQRTIPLSLSIEEVWTLFQKHAGITDNTSNSLKARAKRITKECKGLPVTIADMASSLKGKTPAELMEALEKFKKAVPMVVEEGLKNPYTSLQLNYDNLNSAEVKSLFLLCSLFPVDYKIPLELLIRFGKGLGLVGEVSSYERARKQVIEAQNMLINSCLLLKDDKENCVKMHDLVRNVAVLIAKKENKVIMDSESCLKALKDSLVRYLWCDIFPYQLDYTNLEFLLVSKSTKDCVKVPDQVFKAMKELRVLVVANVVLENSKSIHWLTNLRCLFLQESEFGDISFIGSLNRLETLMFWSCSIPELPYEITQLTNLQLLDLSRCKIERNPHKVIGRCLQLEELYFIGNSCPEWKDQGENAVAFFHKNETTPKLERYLIEIGKSFQVFDKEDFSSSRGLSIEYFDAATTNATLKNLVQRAEVLSLGEISGGCENIIPDMVQKIGDGMNELVELQLCNSDEIKCMIDTSGVVGAVFPSLTKLRILNLEYMEALCCGPPPPGFFEKLKELVLYNCPGLTSLFTATIAQSLVLLQVLEINNCHRLRHIIRDAEEEIIAIDDDHNNKSAFPKLEALLVQDCQQLEDLGGHWSFNLCNLKKLMVKSCPMLISLFTSSTAKTMTSLEELIIERCNHLKEVFEGPHDEDGSFNLCSLKMLMVIDCPKLISLFTSSTAKTMTLLEELIIDGCYSLEEVFRGPYAEHGQALELPRLKMLSLVELPSLIEVSHGFQLQRVENVAVKSCPMFSGSVDGFQNLSQGQNPVEEEGTELAVEELRGEDVEVQDRNVIGQSSARSQVSREVHNAQARISNIMNTASSSGEVDAVHRSSTNISKEDGDVTQTSLNQDVAPLAATNQDVNSSALIAATNQEYQTREEGGNQKKMEDNNVIEQGTTNYPESREAHKTQNESPLPEESTLPTSPCTQIVSEDLQPDRVAQPVQEYNQNDNSIKSDNRRGDSRTQGLDTSINHFDTQQRLLEQNISLTESMKEGTELEEESEKEKKGEDAEVEDRNATEQSTSSSQESSEVHNAQAGTSNINNTPLLAITASSSGEVDAVHKRSINISKEDRDVTLTSLNEDVAPLATTNLDVNLSALTVSTNQEYQTPEEGGNQKKMEHRNVIAQSTTNYLESREAHKTQNGSPLPESTLQNSPYPHIVPEDLQPERVAQSGQEYNQNDHDIKSDKGRGDSQTQGFDTSVNHFDTQQSLQEQNISLREVYLKLCLLHVITTANIAKSKKEIAKKSHQKGHAAEKSTSTPSSLDFVVEQPVSELVLVDRQEGLEQNQVTIEFLEITDATSEVVHNAIGLTNNGFSRASTSKKLQNVARTSPISQSFSSVATAAVSPGNMPSGLDLNKATETIMDFPKLWEYSYQGPRKEGRNEHYLDNLSTGAGSSGEATLELPSSVLVAQNVDITTAAVIPAPIQAPLLSVSLEPIHDLPTEVDSMMSASNGKLVMTREEEYAPFRDIVAVKKKHIPLLEQALAIYPSLWAWHEKPRHPQMKQFGYTMLGNMLEFLASTRWRDVTEKKEAEFESLLDGLETFGFDTQWLANTCAMIKPSKTIDRMKMLELQAMALESELQKTKLELDGIGVKLENFNHFIGF